MKKEMSTEDRFVALIPALGEAMGSGGFDRVPDEQKPALLDAFESALSVVPKSQRHRRTS